MQIFDLEGHDYVELCDLLKLTGLCGSGGIAKLEIAAGRARVDGEIELRKRAKLRAGQMVEYGGEQIRVDRGDME